MRKHGILVGGALLVAALGTASAAWALNQARMFGVISDENGKPLPGVVITVTCPEVASIRIDAKTDAKGKWGVTLIDATKSHHFKFEKPGYQTMEQDLKLPIGANERRDFSMAPLVAEESAAPSSTELAIGLFNEGAEAFQMGDTVTAKQKMTAALAEDPTLLAAHGALASLHAQDKEWDVAVAEAEKVLAVEPQNERALRVAVDGYRALGKKDKAAAAATALGALDPTVAATDLYNQGVQAYNAGDMAKALGFFEKSAEANADYAKVHYMLGMCYVSNGQNAKAKQSMETFIAKAAADDPDLATAKEMLAYLK
ncbi:MAG: tetratricopeptide repeat protein [Thermoanaerobaculia bacterium]